MSLRRWLTLIGVMVALGSAKVAQQTAIWQRAYALGRQAAALHDVENETRWLSRDVLALESPARLAKTMQEQRMNLVGWSVLSMDASSRPLVLAREPELRERR